jgi:hypothetical protein
VLVGLSLDDAHLAWKGRRNDSSSNSAQSSMSQCTQ